MTHITVTGQWKTEFVYDGLGRRRVVKEYTNSAGAWLWLLKPAWCMTDVALQERDASGNVLVTYTRGLDLSERSKVLAASAACWREQTGMGARFTMRTLGVTSHR